MNIARVPWALRGQPARRRALLIGGAIAGLLAAGVTSGCSHDWASYDPRIAAGGGSSSSAGIGGASSSSTGHGGAASSSSTSSAGGAGSGGATSSSGMGGASSSMSSTTSSTASSTASSTSASSSSSGGGGGPTHCGGTSVLSDDFNGSDPGEVWKLDAYNGATISEAGGELVLGLPSNMASGAWADFYTKRYYDLRGDAVSIEVTSAGNTATTAIADFFVGFDDDDYIEIYQKNGTLTFGAQVPGSYSTLASVPYDAVAHRHWRLREDSGTTYWETSDDGTSWITQAQMPTANLFPLDLVWVVLGGGTDGGEVNPGQVHYDHLNGGGAPKNKWCATSSLTDNFDDGMAARIWSFRSWADDPSMLSEASGELVLSYLPNASAWASYISASSFDLTNSSLVVEATQVADASIHSNVHIGLDGPAKSDIEFNVDQGGLVLGVTVMNTWQQIAYIPYDPGQHKWWRIREASNTLYWEASPDGKAWSSLAQLSPVPFAIDAMDIDIGGGTWQNEVNPGSAHLDNLNLGP